MSYLEITWNFPGFEIESISPEFAALAGHKPEEMINIPWPEFAKDMMYSKDLKKVINLFTCTWNQHPHQDIHITIWLNNVLTKWIQHPSQNGSGQLISAFGYIPHFNKIQ